MSSLILKKNYKGLLIETNVVHSVKTFNVITSHELKYDTSAKRKV